MANVHWHDNRSVTILLSENAELKKEIDELRKENARLSDLLPKSKEEDRFSKFATSTEFETGWGNTGFCTNETGWMRISSDWRSCISLEKVVDAVKSIKDTKDSNSPKIEGDQFSKENQAKLKEYYRSLQNK